MTGLPAEAASPKERKKAKAELAEKLAGFKYNEVHAQAVIERGGSRSDRCLAHRRAHRTNTQGMAVPYVDLVTIGEVHVPEEDSDRGPTGPFGGLGPLPEKHKLIEGGTPLSKFEFGMNDQHIMDMLKVLRDDHRRVLILKAGTGTGKSTFGPYRLMDPPTPADLTLHGITKPPEGIYRLTDLGPIIVTEPRVAAATGVATFVGEQMSGAGGVGPGFPVGYQVSGDRHHDEACQLIYVTDGTMINWMKEGRLSKIGTVIVDEAHERSTNIDFILGFLRRDLEKYPHLRVIVTSATFDTKFYEEYFGGPEKVSVMEIKAVKTVGYGMPLFPALDSAHEEGSEPAVEGKEVKPWSEEAIWPLVYEQPAKPKRFIETHWPTRLAPPLKASEVLELKDAGKPEDLHDTTGKLLELRYDGFVPKAQWKEKMPGVLADFIVQLAKGLDKADIFGDILGFLPTGRTIEEACLAIEAELGTAAEVYRLTSSIDDKNKRLALAPRRKGELRKIVISTNLAETSLTVEGVRFVVDSGLIAQSEWEAEIADGGIPTKAHSKSGIKQRWGRVGRKVPGWVFPLYTKEQFASLDEDTPPGATRENLESLVMTARMGGIDDIKAFPWPAAFLPTVRPLDEAGLKARDNFLRELDRADLTVKSSGAVDADGHPTSFGKELTRFSGLGSISSALAIMYADRLGCVPEVAMILALLEDTRLVGDKGLFQDERDWPDEWRLEAATRHRGLATLAEDDAHLILLICAAWEREDKDAVPWGDSPKRREWCRLWWLNNDVLQQAAIKRQEALAGLSPKMTEKVKRYVEPALLDRARGVIARALSSHEYRLDGDVYVAVDPVGLPIVDGVTADPRRYEVDRDCLVAARPARVIALRRREGRGGENFVANLVAVPHEYDARGPSEQRVSGAADAMRLVLAFKEHAKADPGRNRGVQMMERWPVGKRVDARFSTGDRLEISESMDGLDPFPRPETETEPGGAARPQRKRRRWSDDEDRYAATRADSDGDIRLGGKAKLGDEEQEAQRAFKAADAAAENVSAECGTCDACLSGDPVQACTNAARKAPESRPEDVLLKWRGRTGQRFALDQPEVTIIDAQGVRVEGSPEPGWYEVFGYSPASDGRYAVRLRPDWRRPGAPADPAMHEDVYPGQVIEVEVGQLVTDHGGALRLFNRPDGEGRFVLREASFKDAQQEARDEIAVSLSRGNHGLLEQLVPGATCHATVVPARGEHCYTITLLELLHQHLRKFTPLELLADPTRPKAAREKYWPAVVHTPPNAAGWLTFRLLHEDSTRGVQHFFDYRPGASSPEEEVSVVEVRDGPPGGGVAPAERSDFAKDQLYSIRLHRKHLKLAIAGQDLDAIEELKKRSGRQFELSGVEKRQAHARAPFEDADDLIALDDPDDDEADDELEDDEVGTSTAARVAGMQARLVSVRDKPLDRNLAQALADLEDSSQWRNRVWTFWARTHHLSLHSQNTVLPGETSKVSDVPATLTLSPQGQLPGDFEKEVFDAFLLDNPKGKVLEGVVKNLISAGAFIELAPDVNGWINIGEMTWTRTEEVGDVLTAGDVVRVLLYDAEPDRGRLMLSMKRLVPSPLAVFQAKHKPGEPVTGIVTSLEAGRVELRLYGDVTGFVTRGDLSWTHVGDASDAYSLGDEVEAAVVSFGEKEVRLSVKQLVAHPFDTFVAKYQDGRPVKAVVKGMTAGKADLELDGGIKGYVVKQDLRHDPVGQVSDVLKVGDELTVKVVSVSQTSREVKVSVKALLPAPPPPPPPFDAFVARHRIGAVLTGTVKTLANYGAFINLAARVDGLVHVTEISNSYVNLPSDLLKLDQPVRVRIITIDERNHKIGLTMRNVDSPAPSQPVVATPPPAAAAQPPVARPAVRPVDPPTTPVRAAAKRTADATGATVEEAIDSACRKLGLSRFQVSHDVLDPGKESMVKRFRKAAVVRVTER